MNELELKEYRIERLKAAVEKVTGGNKLKFDQKLGAGSGKKRDGAFLGQMLRGDRAISEKTIRIIESWPGMRGWFNVEQSKNHLIETDKSDANTTHLSQTHSDPHIQYVIERMEELDEEGRTLVKHAVVAEIKRYKDFQKEEMARNGSDREVATQSRTHKRISKAAA